MSLQTRFLSRLLGLYCLIIGVAMIARPQATVHTVTLLLDDPPLLYVLGVILIFGGLAMVLVHNIWRGGAAAVVVTVIGWLTLVKGLLLIGVAPVQPASLYLQQLRYEQLYPLYTLLALGLGAYLTYAGFSSARSRP
jgi:hypothetical protein